MTKLLNAGVIRLTRRSETYCCLGIPREARGRMVRIHLEILNLRAKRKTK